MTNRVKHAITKTIDQSNNLCVLVQKKLYLNRRFLFLKSINLICACNKQISNESLDDLRARLENARLPESLPDTKFEYGVNSAYMSEVVEYWRHGYDWRKQEAIINSFPQYMTTIEGLYIHFIHVKPMTGNKHEEELSQSNNLYRMKQFSPFLAHHVINVIECNWVSVIR